MANYQLTILNVVLIELRPVDNTRIHIAGTNSCVIEGYFNNRNPLNIMRMIDMF